MALRVGLIGAGYWGPNLARHFNGLPGSSLTALCDLNADHLNGLGERYPRAKRVQDYRLLLEDPEVDAVAIATPVPTHYPLAREALLAGKHVWVEKPLAFTTPEARELVEIAETRGLTLMVDHTYLYHPAIRHLKEMMDGGALGWTYYINAVRTNLGILHRDHNALWSLAPHDVAILLYLLGDEPLEVTAQGGAFLQPEDDVEDVAFVTLRFPGEIMAHIHVSWLDPQKVRNFTVVGSRRMAVFKDADRDQPLRTYGSPAEDRGSTPGEKPVSLEHYKGETVAPVKWEEPLKLACQHFLDCIEKGQRPLSDGHEGLRVVKVLERAHRSLKESNVRVRSRSERS